MVRLAHLSDIHLSAPRLGWGLGDLVSKRLTSWINLLGRRRLFRDADRVLELLMKEVAEHDVDHVVFSGDATALGFEPELAAAAAALRVGRLPGIAVPGNHDYCTRRAAGSGAFERQFAPWQQGRRMGDFRYPFAQRVGHLWLIGVNAATGNRLPWDASGRVGGAQLERLARLLTQLEPGPRILVTHFPICLANGRCEPSHHGLRDLRLLIEAATAGGVCLWLHGHRHSPYHLHNPPGAPFPAICTGSATQRGIYSYNQYTIDGHRLEGQRRVYDPDAGTFVERECFTLELFSPGR